MGKTKNQPQTNQNTDSEHDQAVAELLEQGDVPDEYFNEVTKGF